VPATATGLTLSHRVRLPANRLRVPSGVVQGGTQRVSFLVGPNGRIAHVWPQVSPAKHAAEVLEEVRRRTAPEAAAG